MNTDEREERLKQIRERRYAATLPANQRGLLPTASWVDVDFLLSEIDRRPLRDSVGCEYHSLECGVDEFGSDCTCGAYRRNQSRLRDADAATQMRDKCVAHLRAKADALDVRQETECPSGTGFTSEAKLRRRIATELESLTLNVEQKEAK